MTERKAVHLEEYSAELNKCLRRHQDYRPDMEIKNPSARGCWVLDTTDQVLSQEDKKVFEEVLQEVHATHRLITQ